jgi:serine protease Do
MSPSKLALIIIVTVNAFSKQALSADNTQQIFERAKSYTIKIKSSISRPFEQDKKGTFTGAGFIIDLNRKWAITNAHVVSRSKAILQVSSFGSDFHSAKAIYIDPDFDIAVIQLENIDGLIEADLECNKIVHVGLPVGAYGHPWSQSYTGTKGIISGRTSDLEDVFGDFLQTDAPINPGNSGGPLINLETGKVIGINTAGLNKAQNMNYAVPAEEICTVVSLLKKGIDPTPPEIPLSFFKDVDEKNTLRISDITKAGKKFAARIGDQIIAAGKSKIFVNNEAQLRNALRGEIENAILYVIRNQKEIILYGPMLPLKNVLSKRAIYFSDLLVRKSEDRTFSELFGQGSLLKIEFVDAGGVGESRGIQAGDILISIDGKVVKDLDETYQALQSIRKSKATVRLQFKRLSFEKSHIFTYRDRTLPIGEISLIDFEETKAQPKQKRFLASENEK